MNIIYISVLFNVMLTMYNDPKALDPYILTILNHVIFHLKNTAGSKKCRYIFVAHFILGQRELNT